MISPMCLSYYICIPVISSIIIILLFYLQSLFDSSADIPKIYCTSSTLTKHIVSQCSSMSRPFHASFWLRNGHIQTILGYIRRRPECLFEREYLLMNDGGVVALDWVVRIKDEYVRWRSKSPVLIILPGLGLGASSVSDVCCLAYKRGFIPVVFNKRGHGNSFLLTPKMQTYGDPSDFRSVINYVQSQFLGNRISAVAYGMGTNILFSYMGEYGSSCRLTSAVCISPGYDAKHLLTSCISFPYDIIMLYLSKRQLSSHVASLSKVIKMKAVMATNSLLDFEELLCCRPSGYASMDQYWDRNNPMREVDEVTIPVLCINSLDDPICKKQCIPYSLFTDCPNFMLLTTTHGGHCAFLEGYSLEPWADSVALDYIMAVLSFNT